MAPRAAAGLLHLTGVTGQLLNRDIDWLTKHPETAEIPQLAVLVHGLHMTVENVKASLKDPSGSIQATISAHVLEDFPQISIGSAMLLRNVCVYRPTRASLHLIVHSENVSNVWDQVRGDDQRVQFS